MALIITSLMPFKSVYTHKLTLLVQRCLTPFENSRETYLSTHKIENKLCHVEESVIHKSFNRKVVFQTTTLTSQQSDVIASLDIGHP